MNRPSSPVERKLVRALRPRTQWWAAPVAFLATMLALPVNAGITIPDDPLTTGNRVAPNILFILDDSGSMAFDYMPDSVPDTDNVDVSMKAYTRNTVYYNPATTYQAWMKADGNRMTGGTGYGAVYGSFNNVGGTTINLASTGSCKRFNYNTNATTDEPASGGTNVCGGTQTFYVPKDTSQTSDTYLKNGRNYYRYQILTDGRIIRSEYVTYTAANTPATPSTQSGTLGNSGSGTINSGTYKPSSSTSWTFSVPPDANGANPTNLVIKSTGGSATAGQRGADLYVRRNNQPTTGSYDYRGIVNGNVETITVASPASGTYNVRLYAQTNYTGTVTVTYSYSYDDYSAVSDMGCDITLSGYGWRNCTAATPTGRSVADEKTNYATWFSYHRTRMKIAKAGASEAFKSQGNKVRVGLRTIWQRAADHANPIPVQDGNDGRFVNNPNDPNTPQNEATTTRNTWYSRMQSVIGYNGTPLHGALENAGKYFESTSDSGPYGPQATASQYSCRQNFTILTTDGYWNNASNYSGNIDAGNNGVGEQDNNDGPTHTGPKGLSGGYTASTPYRSSDSNTLADVAMKYWKNDLRSGLTNNVPKTDANPAFWQHMVTFGISIGLSGTSGYQSVDEVPSNYNSWRNPSDAEDADRIDDLLHAAVNGHGAFVSAINPSEFTAGLTKALATIAQRTASYSNVATNSTSLNTGAKVFSASYTSGLWTGKVVAYPISQDGVSATPSWTSSVPAWGTRKIFTHTGSAGSTFPTSAQQSALVRTGGPVDYPVTGAQNADYIKGDDSLEESKGGLLRNRASRIGDIVGSSPAYVQDTNTLYVGANDGMLHAFSAVDGAEQFAYVPGIININYLASLSRGDYDHKFFVDGPIAVTPRTDWSGNANILVGSLGRGGKGLYALDVSNPASFGTTNVKWEKNDGKLGLVLGMPVLANVRGGGGAVIVGNGPNSADDKAYLVVRSLSDGSVIREIPTDNTTNNGLAAPIGIYAADGKTVVYAYAGDMQGNVWKFDMTNADADSWTATKIFHAEKTAGTPQPITSGLALAIDPSTSKRWVFFGTGSFLTTTDADDKTVGAQSMYAFMDDGGSYTRANLKQRKLLGTGNDERTLDPTTAGDLASTQKGWYLDLPGAGERIVQNTQINGTHMLTASMMPEGDACEASGTGYINALDAFTGTAAGGSLFDTDGDGVGDTSGGSPVLSVDLGVGMPTLPVILPGQIVVGGSGDGTAGGLGGTDTLPMSWQRVSWREIRKD